MDWEQIKNNNNNNNNNNNKTFESKQGKQTQNLPSTGTQIFSCPPSPPLPSPPSWYDDYYNFNRFKLFSQAKKKKNSNQIIRLSTKCQFTNKVEKLFRNKPKMITTATGHGGDDKRLHCASNTTPTLHLPAGYCRAPPVVHQYRRNRLTLSRNGVFICDTRNARSLVGGGDSTFSKQKQWNYVTRIHILFEIVTRTKKSM